MIVSKCDNEKTRISKAVLLQSLFTVLQSRDVVEAELRSIGAPGREQCSCERKMFRISQGLGGEVRGERCEV